jgi:hypothetical protein
MTPDVSREQQGNADDFVGIPKKAAEARSS